MLEALVLVQDIVYGFKSTQLFNVGDLFESRMEFTAAAAQVGQQLLPAAPALVDDSLNMPSNQGSGLSSWQNERLTGQTQCHPL